MKAKIIPILAALAVTTVFSGCNQPVVNLTVPQAPANPSDIYTLTVNAQPNNPAMVDGSLKAFIVIEGKEHEMSPSAAGSRIFQYEYQMPSDRSEAKYYFIVRYVENQKGLPVKRDYYSPVNTLEVVSRYVLAVEISRGPVGTVAPVVGRGFTPLDRIVIGGIEAQTIRTSENSLTFVVPPLPAGHDYPVELHSGSSVFPAGVFHIDAADLKVTPSSLDMASGESRPLLFDMGQNAPEGGVKVDVLTDVPASVIMPIVTIPGGASTVSVNVTGGAVGKGSLHISAPGFNEVIVPINVSEATSSTPPPAPAPIAPVPTVPDPSQAPAPAAVIGS